LLQKRLDDSAAVGAFQAVYLLGDSPVEIVDNGIYLLLDQVAIL
jgi:hypothetical protein